MFPSFLRSFCAPRSRHKMRTLADILVQVEAVRQIAKAGRVRYPFLPALENLEDRTVPTVAYPTAQIMNPGALVPASASALPAGFSPAQIRTAYGFNLISFSNGTVAANGAGQTIAIVDAYDQPNLASNLATFDATYGIAAPPSFTKVNETGGSTLPAASASWGLEESLDVEWAHAIAPGAKIVLVEANSANLSDLLTAVNTARNLAGVSVVSMSWGAGEFSGESSYDSYFTTPAGHTGVTFVASSGDGGSADAPEWPSISSNVLAVGGTQLSTDAAGDYLSETAWSGSGGGISLYESQPAYQKGVVTQSTTKRTVPDVAYDASGSSPFAVYDTDSYSGWLQVYGTSAGAPQWSALVAIADQGRALAGKAALDGATQTLPAIYQLPSADFHDITSGSNGGYSAGVGYDLVTGRGSPRANLVVPGLIGGTSAPAPTPPTVVTAAHASASPVTGTTTTLGVLGSDAAGAANLTYTWTILSSPSGVAAAGFSVNGTNAADNTTVTFHGAGTYSFLVTLKDPAGLTATSSVTVTVDQTLTYLTLTPGSASVVGGKTQQFTVSALDQFGTALSKQPAWTWSVSAGPGAVSSTGLYTAPASGSGSSSVHVSGGGLSISASVTYTAPLPTAPSNATAAPVSSGWVLVTWKNNSTNDSGFLIERSINNGSWSFLGAVGANVTFFDDTSASKANSYSYRVAAYNSMGDSAYSNATASVKPTAIPTVAVVSSPATSAATVKATVTTAAAGEPALSTSGASTQQVVGTPAAGVSGSQALGAPQGAAAASDAFWQSWGAAAAQDWLRQGII
jgi:subtilase family serine protease